LPPIIEAAKTIKRHWDDILRWFDTRIANGFMEAINSLVQAPRPTITVALLNLEVSMGYMILFRSAVPASLRAEFAKETYGARTE